MLAASRVIVIAIGAFHTEKEPSYVHHSFKPGEQAKKDILLLIADDLGKNLGCYGAAVKTPKSTIWQLPVYSLHTPSPAPLPAATLDRSSIPVYTPIRTASKDQRGSSITS